MKETTNDANKDISSHSPFQQSSLSFSVGNYKSQKQSFENKTGCSSAGLLLSKTDKGCSTKKMWILTFYRELAAAF